MGPASALEFPYTALGDLGAASMPTAAVIAVESMLRGDPPGSTALVSGSSDEELRGAVLLSRA
jgi:hypothetical protein